MKHKRKIKMARKMLTREERKNGTPIFQSEAWEKRAMSRRIKVWKQRTKSKLLKKSKK